MVRQPPQSENTGKSPDWVYGFGVTPVGLYAEFARSHRVHPIAEANGGIVASTEPIPLRGDGATGLNFLFDFGGGVRWQVSPRRAVTTGYRFQHISNAGTTNFNPGLDNHVFYLSFSFCR
jgi:opacity protein-like surface antigen